MSSMKKELSKLKHTRSDRLFTEPAKYWATKLSPPWVTAVATEKVGKEHLGWWLRPATAPRMPFEIVLSEEVSTPGWKQQLGVAER